MFRGFLLAVLVVLVASAPLSENNNNMCEQGAQPLQTQTNLELAANHVTQANNYSCTECRAMVSALQEQCSETGANQGNRGFAKRCFDKALPFTHNGTFLNGKCNGFLEFCKEIYCPLDPCLQVTTMRNEAPDAICNLLKCYETEKAEKIEVLNKTKPRACPTYVRRISEACRAKKLRQSNPAHRQIRQTRKQMIASFETEVCSPYSPQFEHEGCSMVLDAIRHVEDPADPCSALLCDKNLDADEYCAMTLNMSATEPVQERKYVAWLQGTPFDENVTKCDKASIQGWGLKIMKASYGSNCFVNGTNNIFKRLRERCQGKIECTYGNLDLPQQRSDFVGSLQSNTTAECEPNFEIQYRCHMTRGEVQTITHDNSAKFMAVPFSCISQLSKEQRDRYKKVKKHLETAISGRH